ncbi:MAG TPA: potassium-transporting ATPase subunit KdpA [Planctomycetota bacterium]|jgi:K+-transporting ATPase ATPase A chain|nr:potassium-transporting ATPase subunit KdpA [Planctomycetota bacterium]
MTLFGWIELGIFSLLLFLLTKPVGRYLVQVLDAEGKTFLDRIFGPVERILYRLFRVDPKQEQDWKHYTLSVLAISVVSCLFTYALLRLQEVLPLNPQKLPGVAPDLAFNTAVSFTTNTNWQSYGGESTLSYFSQMVALALHNFLSAGVGIAVAAALVRGIARHSARTIGNFWVDLVRIHLYVLLPVCVVYALFLVSQGMIQNFRPYDTAQLTEPFTVQVPKKDDQGNPLKDAKGNPVLEDQKVETQSIAQGPMASQVAIKMLGTNGGGFVNANASHPFENPTPLSNFVQMLSIFSLGAGLVYYFGHSVRSPAHGWAVWLVMYLLFLAGVLLAWHSEAAGNPRLTALGVDPAGGNMEGKEVRFGIFESALFATITTDASCGAVNAMHDSFTPLGGLVPLINMHLGEIIYGGVGAGLYGMIVFIVVAVFLFGLMAGRTPEYLGKKIESYDVKVCALAILIVPVLAMGFTAWAAVSGWGQAGLNNSGPHGLSEMLYAFSSAGANNGSAFAGLTTNTPLYNTTMALVMWFGRFLIIVPALALAGSLASKKIAPSTAGTFPLSGGTFVALLIGTILIVGALTFFPAWALGPVVEHFQMTGSTKLY